MQTGIAQPNRPEIIGINNTQRGRIMAYSAKAKLRRKCTGRKADGTPCQAWARWGDDRQLCSSHAIKKRKPSDGYKVMKSKAKCECEAYQWPHRPGSGLCRWPDPPLFKCLTPAGTHDEPRWARTAWGRAYGRAYVSMMRSAIGNNGGTKTGGKRGRPSKDKREMISLLTNLHPKGQDSDGDQF